MQRTERCFRLFRIGYAVVYQILLLAECASQYMTGGKHEIAVFNLFLNNMMLALSLYGIFRKGQIRGDLRLSLKLCLAALGCIFLKTLVLQAIPMPFAYTELLNGELVFMVYLFYHQLWCYDPEFF
ncbi:hypothetical protein [Stomatobaculum longum]|uniref:hypothetical protein n=1 Tax=Stomatobaculum longum TaxID=796942 RepID=UPI0028E5EF49|nr:hypothetical protein [Stomatobaculum longum]